MISHLRTMMITLFTLLLMVVTGWLQPAAAQAIVVTPTNGESYWARWTVEMDFPNDTINARWTVFLGKMDGTGQMYIENQMTEGINCTPVGNVQIKNGEAILDGTSHFECVIPSFYEAVEKLLDGAPMPFPPERFTNQSCSCKNPRPWVAADVTLSPTNTKPNPLVYQEDNAMQFVITQAGLMATSHLLLNDGAAVPEQLAWHINFDVGNQLWSGSGTPNFLLMAEPSWQKSLSADFYALAQKLSLSEFLHWANTAPDGVVFDHDVAFEMTNEQTIFLVGYNGNDHFVGKIRKLAWDPPCGPQDGK